MRAFEYSSPPSVEEAIRFLGPGSRPLAGGTDLLPLMKADLASPSRLVNVKKVLDDRILEDAGTKPVRLPPHSPNCNAHLERFHRSLREECLDRMIFFGEHSLRQAVKEFLTHFHRERNHQGLGNVLIFPAGVRRRSDDRVVCRERLGGLLKYYHRPAA